jgi:urea transport system ATP-binding protein
MLRVENLDVFYGDVQALNGVSLDIEEGAIVAIVGANGAGKTTLMDLISSKTKATGGRILFKGQNITNWSEHKIARAGIGRKFQVPSIFKNLTVRQNYQVASSGRPGVLRNVFEPPGRQGRERIDEVLMAVGLEDEAETVAGNLSHGQTQWMELGMVLVQRPELILLDEPTAGMTGLETEKTSRIINELRGHHTLLIVEHDMTFVRSICETITVMHMGRKLAEGPVKAVENDKAVRDAYLGSGGLGRA